MTQVFGFLLTLFLISPSLQDCVWIDNWAQDPHCEEGRINILEKSYTANKNKAAMCCLKEDIAEGRNECREIEGTSGGDAVMRDRKRSLGGTGTESFHSSTHKRKSSAAIMELSYVESMSMVVDKDRVMFDAFAIVEITNIVLSFLANAFLILAIMRSSKDLGGYRFLLFAFTLNDIYFPLVHSLTFPIICSYRNAFIMFSHGFLNSKFSVCLFAASHSQAMPIMAHLFIYRLIALKWSSLLRFYTAFNTAVLLLASVFLQLNLWFWNCWFNYDSDKELDDYIKPYLEEEFPGENPVHIGALYYNDNGIRWSAILSTMGFNGIMTFWVGVIVMCSVMIARLLKESGRSLSRKTEVLQRQLFRLLILQMVVPFMCVYFPCAAIINVPIFFQISAFPNLVSAALTFFPLIDAVITIFGVRNYREYLFSFFTGARNLALRGSSMTAVSSVQRYQSTVR